MKSALSLVFLFFSPCLFAQQTDTRSVVVVSGMQQEGDIAAGPNVISVLSGGSPSILTTRLNAIDPSTVRAVVSFGVAGGLISRLHAGNVAVGTQILEPDGTMYTTSPTIVSELITPLQQNYIRVRTGSWFGAQQNYLTAAAKAQLAAQTGAIAVDEETGTAAAWAAANNLPFGVIRTISDTVTQTLPPLSDSAVNADGSYNIGAILAGLFQDPFELGELIELGITSSEAFNNLQVCRRLIDLGSLNP
jgi:adenosylhomocysteine nucleosidase